MRYISFRPYSRADEPAGSAPEVYSLIIIIERSVEFTKSYHSSVSDVYLCIRWSVRRVVCALVIRFSTAIPQVGTLTGRIGETLVAVFTLLSEVSRLL